MKRLLLIIGFLFIFNTANAEVYLLVNKSTQEIKDMSPENDAIIPAGYEKIVLPGKIGDYELQNHASYYKYKDKKFVLNVKKISDEELEKQKGIDALKKKETDRKLAIDKLKVLGLTEDEINALR